jgi:hypothetical protein
MHKLLADDCVLGVKCTLYITAVVMETSAPTAMKCYMYSCVYSVDGGSPYQPLLWGIRATSFGVAFDSAKLRSPSGMFGKSRHQMFILQASHHRVNIWG